MITEIQLITGEQVPINTRISIAEFQKAQKENLLSKQMLNNMLRRQKSNGVISAEDYLNAAFVSYRSAGGRLTLEEFKEVCPFDLELLADIFGQMMTGGKPIKKSQFQTSVEKSTKK